MRPQNILCTLRAPLTMNECEWMQVLTYIIIGAGAVSTEVMYLAYKGDQAITWSAACDSFGGFCHKATASVALTFAVILCYASLSLVSSYRLFSRFDPPASPPNTVNTSQMAAFHAWPTGDTDELTMSLCTFCPRLGIRYEIYGLLMCMTLILYVTLCHYVYSLDNM